MVDTSGTLSAKDVLIGRKIGNCTITKRIGAGGMGTVYRAEHAGLGKPVAIKILGAQLMGSEDAVARFLLEARTAAKLDHPQVVQVHDVGAADDFYYIVMQFVEGRSLDVILRDQTVLPVRQAVSVTRYVANALAAAHKLGIVHRDIKPANILVSKEGRVKVADFGLARDSETGRTISSSGQILGTPAYMSPEQAEGKPTDARSDIYSLGCTLYHLIGGKRPFEGDQPLATVLKQISEEPTALEMLAPAAPPALCALVRRMTAKDPAKRPQTAEALLGEIEALGQTRTKSTASIWIAAAVLLLIAGLSIWAMSSHAPPPPPVERPTAAPKPAEKTKPPEPKFITTAHGVKITGMEEAIEKVADPAQKAEARDVARTMEAFYDTLAAKEPEKLKDFFEGGDAGFVAERMGGLARIVKDRIYTLTQVEVTGFAFDTRGPRTRVVAVEGTLSLVGGPGQSMTQPTGQLAWMKRGDRWVVAPRLLKDK